MRVELQIDRWTRDESGPRWAALWKARAANPDDAPKLPWTMDLEPWNRKHRTIQMACCDEVLMWSYENDTADFDSKNRSIGFDEIERDTIIRLPLVDPDGFAVELYTTALTNTEIADLCESLVSVATGSRRSRRALWKLLGLASPSRRTSKGLTVPVPPDEEIVRVNGTRVNMVRRLAVEDEVVELLASWDHADLWWEIAPQSCIYEVSSWAIKYYTRLITVGQWLFAKAGLGPATTPGRTVTDPRRLLQRLTTLLMMRPRRLIRCTRRALLAMTTSPEAAAAFASSADARGWHRDLSPDGIGR